jgi:hypothetical protein
MPSGVSSTTDNHIAQRADASHCHRHRRGPLRRIKVRSRRSSRYRRCAQPHRASRLRCPGLGDSRRIRPNRLGHRRSSQPHRYACARDRGVGRYAAGHCADLGRFNEARVELAVLAADRFYHHPPRWYGLTSYLLSPPSLLGIASSDETVRHTPGMSHLEWHRRVGHAWAVRCVPLTGTDCGDSLQTGRGGVRDWMIKVRAVRSAEWPVLGRGRRE